MNRLLPTLLLAAACSTGPSEEEQAEDLRTRYFDGLCRLYSEPVCISNAEESCFGTISFDSQSECVSFFAFFGGSCDFATIFAEDLDSATACVEQIEGWACETEPICEEDGSFAVEGGACATTTAAVEAACGGTTTTTTM
mgnify:CR=1 FL=1